jgi:hypothetical protein
MMPNAGTKAEADAEGALYGAGVAAATAFGSPGLVS